MRGLIVDDHPVARHGLARVLSQLGCQRIAEAGGISDALTAAAEQPDLILLDLRMAGVPDTSVLCAQLRVVAPRARIVLITAFEETDPIERCLAAGADACLLKDSSVEDLHAQLRAVLAGGRVIDPRVAQALALHRVDQLRHPQEGRLTARERTVLGLLADGCSNRAIAERLNIAETTVKGYVSSVLSKLGADSRLQAVVRARATGVL